VSLIFAGRNLLRHQLKMDSSSSSRKIPRPWFIKGLPDRGKIVYKQTTFHNSQRGPCTLKFAHPSATITGIACYPVADANIQAPEATVTEGGVNCKHVHIYLKPEEEGNWAYELTILAEENHETRAQQ